MSDETVSETEHATSFFHQKRTIPNLSFVQKATLPSILCSKILIPNLSCASHLQTETTVPNLSCVQKRQILRTFLAFKFDYT